MYEVFQRRTSGKGNFVGMQQFNQKIKESAVNSNTIVDILQRRASAQSKESVYSYASYSGSDEMQVSTLTYEELDIEARKVGACLQQMSATGKNAILLYPQGLDFITAFYGCLYAGVIAIPTYQSLSLRYISRIQAIIDNSESQIILTTHSLAERLKTLLGDAVASNIQWVITEEVRNENGLSEKFKKVDLKGDSIAYLQYTSGSTSTPKGVIIDHSNILHNSELIYQNFGHSPHSRGVGWIPYYHDMGLLINILQPVYGGFPQLVMSPIEFMQKPLRWLEAISSFKATTSGAPNFAFDLCADSITPEQKEKLDLSSWNLAFSGAEPVRSTTLEKFYDVFKDCGYRQETIYPAYGMAEATLIVTGGAKMDPPRLLHIDQDMLKENQIIQSLPSDKKTLTMVGNGKALGDVKIAIVDPSSLKRCPDNIVGEIWVSSPSVSRGYWKQPEVSRETFDAHIADSNEGPFLRTGDLGFIDEKELYITGRLKEVIIIRGVNYYPKDIELTVEQSHESFAPNCGAAFSITVDGGEQLVVVQEIKRTHRRNLDVDEVVEALRGAVANYHELKVHAVVLLKPGSIPKTTSGKIQRRYCRELFLNNDLSEMHTSIISSEEVQSPNYYISKEELVKLGDSALIKVELEKSLRNRLSVSLKVEPDKVKSNRGLISLGLDSLSLTLLKQQIEEQFKVMLPMHKFFEQSFDLEELTQLIFDQMGEEKSVELPKFIPQQDKIFEPFPLTDLQYAYWIGCNEGFQLGGVAAHVYLEVDNNDSSFDYARLNAAWQKVVSRHDMMRAVVNSDGQQQILAQTPLYQIKLYDLRNDSAEAVEAKLEEVRSELSHQILPKDKWPLFDIRVTQYSGNHNRIHFSFDLINGDVWSLNILLREWSNFYRDQNIILPPLDISFRDYVMALQKIQESPQYEQSKKYWEKRLGSIPAAPQLPLAKAPESIGKVTFKRRSTKLSVELWTALKEKATSLGITPSSILLAAFGKILSTWSKTGKFTINLTLFNRLALHPNIGNLVGDFTSVTLLEVDDTKLGGFGEFVANLQRQLAMDLEHRYYSGIEVIRDLERNKTTSSKSMMPVVFTSALSANEEMVFSSPTFFGRCGYAISQTPQVWLDHQVYEELGELVLNWDAVEELFPIGMLDQMFESYNLFLKTLASDSAIWNAQIRSLIPQAQLDLRNQYNETGTSYVADGLLHSAFVKQAQITPNNPAIFTADKTISYSELLQASTKIAYFLREANVKPNELVAVFMEKGWEQIAAVMGILQAGGVYLSIDPELPSERQQYLLENAKVNIVLTQQSMATAKAALDQFTTLIIDESFICESLSLTPLSSTQSPDDLAYIIYTSGSTGLPKGVMISHRGALNTVVDINQKFGVTEKDRVLALSSLNFDLSVYDVFGLLSVGGALILPKPHTERNPDHLMELMERYGVTIWNSVPALMEIFVESAEIHQRDLKLRLVLLSGDWIPVTLTERLWNLVDNVRVISLGGATEASIWSIFHPINYVDASWSSIPYGKPLANQRFYVLNEKLGHCPELVPGDLYIGGIGVAKGYLGNPERTAQSFIIHPDNGEYIYRTGDLGRFLPDGNIEFMGREDFQIKIGGFRVELGEIESTLNTHSKIRRAAVKKTVTKAGESLTAYLVLNSIAKSESEVAATLSYDYAAEIEGSEESELLVDKAARRLFKLNQPGIRLLEGSAIALDEADVDIESCYLKRNSSRRFINKEISFSQFSNFISIMRQSGYDGLPRYRYGSAGGLYPVQVYLHVQPNLVKGITGGVYYYNPRENKLYDLSGPLSLNSEVHVKGHKSIFESAAFSIFLVGQLDAIEPMYGKKARDFCLIEAGLITQLFESAGVQNEIGLCQIGAFADESRIKEILHLSDRQILLHGMLGGMVDYNDALRTVPIETQSETSSDSDIIQKISLFCATKLPKYMVPAKFIILDEIPLTNVGKVDYKALPDPNEFITTVTATTTHDSSYQEPHGKMEEIIMDIICEKMGKAEVDVNTNFFELGIDSLTMMKVWRILVEKVELDFPVVKVFEHSTIRSLGLFLTEMKEGTQNNDNQIIAQMERKKNAMRQRFAKKIKH